MAHKQRPESESQPKDSKSLIPAYMVHAIKQELYVQVMGQRVPLTVAGLADGCIGVSLWFDTLAHAAEYGGPEAKLSQAKVTDLKLKDPDTKTKGTSESPTPAQKGRIQ